MKLFIAFFMISFLEQDICTDACFFQHPIFFHSSCRNVHIHTTDSTIFMLNGINSLDTFQNVFNGVVHRVFPCFQCQTLMPHILQSHNFFDNFFLCQFFPGNVFIFGMIRAVHTAIDTVIGQIQGRKHDNTIAIKIFFQLFCQSVNLLDFIGHFTCQQYRSFSVGKTFAQFCLFQNCVDEFFIVLVFLGISQSVQNFFVGDKFLRFH